MIGSAQVLFMANDILTVLYYFVSAFVRAYMGMCIKYTTFLGILE